MIEVEAYDVAVPSGAISVSSIELERGGAPTPGRLPVAFHVWNPHPSLRQGVIDVGLGPEGTRWSVLVARAPPGESVVRTTLSLEYSEPVCTWIWARPSDAFLGLGGASAELMLWPAAVPQSQPAGPGPYAKDYAASPWQPGDGYSTLRGSPETPRAALLALNAPGACVQAAGQTVVGRGFIWATMWEPVDISVNTAAFIRLRPGPWTYFEFARVDGLWRVADFFPAGVTLHKVPGMGFEYLRAQEPGRGYEAGSPLMGAERRQA